MDEEQIYAGVRLVAAANNWSRQTAIHFLTLLTAVTSPALLTVPNALRGPMVEWGLITHLVRRLMRHGEDGRYVIIGAGLSLREGYYYVKRQ